MFDENVCAKSPAPEFVIPKDTTAKERLMAILGYQEIPISITDDKGNTEAVSVLGKEIE